MKLSLIVLGPHHVKTLNFLGLYITNLDFGFIACRSLPLLHDSMGECFRVGRVQLVATTNRTIIASEFSVRGGELQDQFIRFQPCR